MICRLATNYAERLSKCKTVEELKHVGLDIKTDLKNLSGYEDWLRDWYRSCEISITAPHLIPEECLNKEGLKALAKGEISL